MSALFNFSLVLVASLCLQVLCQDATEGDGGLLHVTFTEHESYGDPEVTPESRPSMRPGHKQQCHNLQWHLVTNNSIMNFNETWSQTTESRPSMRPGHKQQCHNLQWHLVTNNSAITFYGTWSTIIESRASMIPGYFEGDIELPKLRNAIRSSLLKWPGGRVPYVIHSIYSSDARSNIIAAMREIESDTKHGSTYCVRFVPKASSDQNYIYIVPQDGCHSPVGRHSGRSLVSIGQGCENKGTVMHELLHTLGFYHEQNRYDRDTYVDIHYNNVPSERQDDFAKLTVQQTSTLNTPYDYGYVSVLVLTRKRVEEEGEKGGWMDRKREGGRYRETGRYKKREEKKR
ncbi:metalloendopeptidase [Elysia marginata]|uniref:Metalloendopeptidase n=1 Tax=Elysia marginata TaxID=1093978 RepID=A0AAV4GBG5_9GAST|nr:metalloendopeptidase [Elysia marginata]